MLPPQARAPPIICLKGITFYYSRKRIKYSKRWLNGFVNRNWIHA